MKIGSNIDIVMHQDGSYTCRVDGNLIDDTQTAKLEEAKALYTACRFKTVAERNAHLTSCSSLYPNLFSVTCNPDGTVEITEDAIAVSVVEEKTPTQLVTEAIQGLMNFFTEFEFEPNYRFINTLSKALMVDQKSAKDYICSYFELVDNSYKNEIKSKVTSKEFDNILKDLSAIAPTKSVNNRFKLYYGSAGAGKTTIGQRESDNRCVVCNASMLPADLMEDFVFDSGKPSFNPSVLWDCMEQGKAIVLDEINLLPFDSLRFLQGILDGKKEFNYKGRTVHINDGFMIIGTMNLSINGMVYGLPEPLVDRCMEMKKFALTPDALLGAII